MARVKTSEPGRTRRVRGSPQIKAKRLPVKWPHECCETQMERTEEMKLRGSNLARKGDADKELKECDAFGV